MYRQMWLRTARDAVSIVNALPPMPVLDAFTADVTEQVISDDGTLEPEVYRLRWLRALIALAGAMEWLNDKAGSKIGGRRRQAVWPLKVVLERELGEWSPYRAAEVYGEIVSEKKDVRSGRQAVLSGRGTRTKNRKRK